MATGALIVAVESGARLLGPVLLVVAALCGLRCLRAWWRKLADPEAFVQPRIVAFLYDTAIAFSGRDSGVFVPIGTLARVFHVLESLASYLLFGIVVSRVAAAAGARLARPGLSSR